jgi:S-adenosylmethionine/arginine decarboxylase-like enzyme
MGRRPRRWRERRPVDGRLVAGAESSAWRTAARTPCATCRSPGAASRRTTIVRSVIPEPTAAVPPSHSHLTAELSGIAAEQLRDATLLSGLLIAAASAGGMSPSGIPLVREHKGSGGVSAVLLLDDAHLAIHSLPAQRTLLFDLVAPASHDFRKALDVFARRLTARDIKSETRGRG